MSRFDRQSFLGANSDDVLRTSTLGLVGLGGGGSHIVLQSAHLGIGGYVLVDPDVVEESNLNRLVCGRLDDLGNHQQAASQKVNIAERVVRGVQEHARIVSVTSTWQCATEDLKRCDVIVGAMDSYKDRADIERFARRYLIPYLDLGMIVAALPSGNFLISGQVVLSMPSAPCLWCAGLLNQERLAEEATNYGAAGPRPQVVWANGVLASTVVGLVAQILTPWFKDVPQFVYLNYDGNRGTITQNSRMQSLIERPCHHYPPAELGDPMFDVKTFYSRSSFDELQHSTRVELPPT